MLNLGSPAPALPITTLAPNCETLITQNMEQLSANIIEDALRAFGTERTPEKLEAQHRALGAYGALQQLFPMVAQIEGLARNAALTEKESAIATARESAAAAVRSAPAKQRPSVPEV